MKKIIGCTVFFMWALSNGLCLADWNQPWVQQQQQIQMQHQAAEQLQLYQRQMQEQNERQHREVIQEMNRIDQNRQDRERMNQNNDFYNPYLYR